MKHTRTSNEDCIATPSWVDTAHLSASHEVERSFGIVFVGESLQRALVERNYPFDCAPFIKRSFAIRTGIEASAIDADDLDFAFIVVDIETDLSLAELVNERLRRQGVFTCRLALSMNYPSIHSPTNENKVSCKESSTVIIPLWLTCNDDGNGGPEKKREAIDMAIHFGTCIARSVLDAGLVGVDFIELCTKVFQPYRVCSYGFETFLFELDIDRSAHSLISHLMLCMPFLSQASAALVVIETPVLPNMDVLRVAKTSMNAVRHQIQAKSYVVYAVTKTNTLLNQYRVSILATKNHDSQSAH